MRMFAANCQPTTLRLKASITKLKNTTPSQQRRYVKSATHKRSGPAAVKSRLTRSGWRTAAGSVVVVRHGLPRRFAPWIPCVAHQPLNTAAPDLLAGAQQRLPHPPGPVGEVVGCVQLADPLEQPLILDATR